MRILLVIAAVFAATPVFAEDTAPLVCSCQATESVITALQLANAVFSGKVLDIRPYKSKRKLPKKLEATEIVFEVYQSWKGVDGRSVHLLRIGGTRSECDFAFEKGGEYLVYADKAAIDVFRLRFVPLGEELLDATRCGRTKTLETSQFDRKLLGPGIIPR